MLGPVGGYSVNTRYLFDSRFLWIYYSAPSYLFIFSHSLLVAVTDRAIWRCLAFHHHLRCQWLRIKILFIGLIYFSFFCSQPVCQHSECESYAENFKWDFGEELVTVGDNRSFLSSFLFFQNNVYTITRNSIFICYSLALCCFYQPQRCESKKKKKKFLPMSAIVSVNKIS